jgi:hypothetical protein
MAKKRGRTDPNGPCRPRLGGTVGLLSWDRLRCLGFDFDDVPQVNMDRSLNERFVRVALVRQRHDEHRHPGADPDQLWKANFMHGPVAHEHSQWHEWFLRDELLQFCRCHSAYLGRSVAR